MLMVNRVMGWRGDRWKPRVRPEPTSTVHAQSGKLRPEGLAGITGAVCIIWYTLVHSIILVTGNFFVLLLVYDPTPPGLDSTLVIPNCLLMPCFACDAMLPLCYIIVLSRVHLAMCSILFPMYILLHDCWIVCSKGQYLLSAYIMYSRAL